MIGPKTETRTKAQIARDEHDAYELVTLRDADVCVRCGGRDPMFGVSRDHRKERSRGGQTVPSNLQLMCGTGSTGCHHWKGTHPKEAGQEGFGCPSWAVPAEWPARRRIRDNGRIFLVWVMYGDDGSVTEISDREAHQRMREEI